MSVKVAMQHNHMYDLIFLAILILSAFAHNMYMFLQWEQSHFNNLLLFLFKKLRIYVHFNQECMVLL